MPNSEELIVCSAISYPKPDSDLFPAAVAIAFELMTKGRKITTNFRKAPVLFMPLDDYGVITLRAWAKKKRDGSMESADEVRAKLNALIADLDPEKIVQSSTQGKMQLAFILDTKPIPDAALRNNLYGAAFGIARRDQLGIVGSDLAQRLDNLTVEQVTECLEKHFAKPKRSVVIVK